MTEAPRQQEFRTISDGEALLRLQLEETQAQLRVALQKAAQDAAAGRLLEMKYGAALQEIATLKDLVARTNLENLDKPDGAAPPKAEDKPARPETSAERADAIIQQAVGKVEQILDPSRKAKKESK